MTIVKASTVTTVTGSANPAAWHQPVTLTAAVSVVAPGSGTPTGLVTFFNGPATLGTAALIAGHAALTTSALTVGDHTITASYAGAATFNGSVSTVLTESVVPAPSATTLPPNSAVTGRPVMLTAKVAVAPPVTGTPTGTVTFFDGPTPLGNATLVAGKATLTTGALGVAAARAHRRVSRRRQRRGEHIALGDGDDRAGRDDDEPDLVGEPVGDGPGGDLHGQGDRGGARHGHSRPAR